MTTESRLDRLEAVVEGVQNEVRTLRDELRTLRAEVNSRFNTVTVIIFGNVATTILTAVEIIAAVLITR